MYLLIALVLQATAPEAVPAAPPTEQAGQPAQTTQPSAPTSEQPEVVCSWQVPTGQRLRRRVCERAEMIEARAAMSADATRDMQGVRGGSIEEPGMRP